MGTKVMFKFEGEDGFVGAEEADEGMANSWGAIRTGFSFGFGGKLGGSETGAATTFFYWGVCGIRRRFSFSDAFFGRLRRWSSFGGWSWS